MPLSGIGHSFHYQMLNASLSLCSGKVGFEERVQLAPRNQVGTVIKIDVSGTRNVVKLFRLIGALVGVLTEFF
ncbi:hypothetical protein PCH70_23130 [Pseudomonas cichorii JBC1]|nr:hypothetical protein PCH70_23130 [Pseudomonas cichorii JBC1]